jgi:hypothetical protein
VALLSTLTAVLRQLQAADRETLAGLMVDLEKIIVKAYTPVSCLLGQEVLVPDTKIMCSRQHEVTPSCLGVDSYLGSASSSFWPLGRSHLQLLAMKWTGCDASCQ